jgi:uncharacterized protein YdhG (YjbR/CyaY superfamily)
MAPTKPFTIDAYIRAFPSETCKRLEQVRATIRKVAPAAVEAITYGMPTYKLGGKNLVHFAGYGRHIGFYPVPSGIAAFKKELASYKQGKGSVQFPLDKPLPLELIGRMVKYRVRESMT